MSYTNEEQIELAERIRNHQQHGRPEISNKIKAQMAADTDFDDIVGGKEDQQKIIDEVPHPPRNGPGSDTDAWRNFADLVTDWEEEDIESMSRSDIILALEDDGYIEPLDPEGNS